MQRWPWITMLLTAIVIVSPLGQEVIHSAFYSGEQLSRSLGQVVLYIYGGALLVAIVIEWLIRWWWASRKRGHGGAGSIDAVFEKRRTGRVPEHPE